MRGQTKAVVCIQNNNNVSFKPLANCWSNNRAAWIYPVPIVHIHDALYYNLYQAQNVQDSHSLTKFGSTAYEEILIYKVWH